MKEINIIHLYASEMNIYGDFGNILVLQKRLAWRGIDAKVTMVGVGEKLPDRADIVFAGGGQDRGQIAVGLDLQSKAEQLHKMTEKGIPMLTICGTYQLFGRRFLTLDGNDIPGIGIFKTETKGSTHRMVGNIVIDTEFGQLVGFENHSGETLLDEGQAAFGTVISGFGNDHSGSTEGARTLNVFGTYMHGPVLPKNPEFADFLISQALARHGLELEPLDDTLAAKAKQIARQRPQ